MKQTRINCSYNTLRSLGFAFEETYLSTNPSVKLREPKMEKRVPKFLMEEDAIH
jgi:integrase/recombinase XerD